MTCLGCRTKRSPILRLFPQLQISYFRASTKIKGVHFVLHSLARVFGNWLNIHQPLRSTAFSIDEIVARLMKHGAELVGEVMNYENIYRLCYIRGVEGLLIGLAEDVRKE